MLSNITAPEIAFVVLSTCLLSGFPVGKVGKTASLLVLVSIFSNGQTVLVPDQNKPLPTFNGYPLPPGFQPVATDIVPAKRFPFYDAYILKTNPSSPNVILAKYGITSSRHLNSFLPKWKDTEGYTDEQTFRQRPAGLSGIGGLDVTKYADGLAKFMVKRAKEELTIAFFEDFKKELDLHEDVKDLFPTTTATLHLIGDQIYDYQRYLLTLRENFERDFNALPDNIIKIIDNHPAYFEHEKALASGLKAGSKIAAGIRDKDHPGDIIASLEPSDLDGFAPKVRQSYTIVRTFSQALRDSASAENAGYWISKKQFQEMSKDTMWLRYFVGLSLEMVHDEDAALFDILNKNNTYKVFMPTLNGISEQTGKLNTFVKTNREVRNAGNETVNGYVEAVADLVATANVAIEIIKPDSPDIRFIQEKFIPFVRNSNNLVGNIANRRYSSALFNAIGLYKLVTPNDDAQTQQFTPTLAWLTRYGGFMAAMIAAETSDEVAAIIETYALPSGSAMIKRKSHFNMAINSYLGIYGGWENASAGVFGVAAPIGVSFSWGNFKHLGSFSILPALIDIGAVASFRFKNDTSQVSKIVLKEIFAPGLFLSFGLKKLPVSLNFGGQLAPLLQRAGANSNDYNIKRNWRFTGSIAVDIPLLNLYNRTSKEKY